MQANRNVVGLSPRELLFFYSCRSFAADIIQRLAKSIECSGCWDRHRTVRAQADLHLGRVKVMKTWHFDVPILFGPPLHLPRRWVSGSRVPWNWEAKGVFDVTNRVAHIPRLGAKLALVKAELWLALPTTAATAPDAPSTAATATTARLVIWQCAGFRLAKTQAIRARRVARSGTKLPSVYTRLFTASHR